MRQIIIIALALFPIFMFGQSTSPESIQKHSNVTIAFDTPTQNTNVVPTEGQPTSRKKSSHPYYKLRVNKFKASLRLPKIEYQDTEQYMLTAQTSFA